MNLDFKIAKKLKDAGFPFHRVSTITKDGFIMFEDNLAYEYPCLEELIKACGDGLSQLVREWQGEKWLACGMGTDSDGLSIAEEGNTPEEAVANLWLVLNKKDND